LPVTAVAGSAQRVVPRLVVPHRAGQRAEMHSRDPGGGYTARRSAYG
jgi:hypothetical protein